MPQWYPIIIPIPLYPAALTSDRITLLKYQALEVPLLPSSVLPARKSFRMTQKILGWKAQNYIHLSANACQVLQAGQS